MAEPGDFNLNAYAPEAVANAWQRVQSALHLSLNRREEETLRDNTRKAVLAVTTSATSIARALEALAPLQIAWEQMESAVKQGEKLTLDRVITPEIMENMVSRGRRISTKRGDDTAPSPMQSLQALMEYGALFELQTVMHTREAQGFPVVFETEGQQREAVDYQGTMEREDKRIKDAGGYAPEKDRGR